MTAERRAHDAHEAAQTMTDDQLLRAVQWRSEQMARLRGTIAELDAEARRFIAEIERRERAKGFPPSGSRRIGG